MTSPADVSGLKHEVAELWRRFKSEPADPRADADPQRQALLDATRLLDAKQKALAAQRDALEAALKLARGSNHVRRTAFAALGMLFGAGLGAGALALVFEPLAALTAGLPHVVGALVFGATLPAPWLLRLR